MITGKVRFGILGCSSVAKRRTIPAILASGNASLERIGSRSEQKARGYAAEFRCAKYGTYEEVLRDPAVDAVYISTPPALHEQWIREAARYGKHVYCEKPVVSGYAAAADIVDLFGKKGLRIMEGYMFRYHPQHALVRELIAAGRIGAPRLFESWYFYPRPGVGNIRLDPGLGGGVFNDAAGYGAAAALEIFGGWPLSVYCSLGLNEEVKVDDLVDMQVRFSGGRLARSVAGFGLQYRSRYAVTGTAGRLEAERAYAIGPEVAAHVALETDAGTERFLVPAADQFRSMVEKFSGVLLGAPEPGESFERKMILTQLVMGAARRSHLEGRAVECTEERV